MKLGVVVLNWNGKDVTPRCLDSIFRSSSLPDQVVVVDNASVDGSAELVRDRYPEVALLVNDSNVGFAEGCNVGIRYLLERGFDLVLLLNNDAIVDTDCLSELRRAAVTHPAAAYGATIYELSQPQKIWFSGGTISRLTLDARHDTATPGPTAHPVDFITGCCLMFRAEALKRIGLLDRDFFAYYEDVDWCLRAKAANDRLIQVPAAIVRHEVSHSFRRTAALHESRSLFSWSESRPMTLYLAYRNRLLIARKHARGTLHLRFLELRRLARAAVHALLLLLVGRFRQARAIGEGTMDGISRHAPRIERYARLML